MNTSSDDPLTLDTDRSHIMTSTWYLVRVIRGVILFGWSNIGGRTVVEKLEAATGFKLAKAGAH